MSGRPAPSTLWAQANNEGGTHLQVVARYRELMREHGHLRKLEPGERPTPLPCGWPGPPVEPAP